MNKHYDVIIIGAGIVGVSTASHLLRLGHSVLLIDKKGIAQETSFGNAGIIDTGYVLPFLPPAINKTPKILTGKEPAARINMPGGLRQLPWIANYYRQSTQANRYKNGKSLRPLVGNAINDHKELLKNTNGLKYLSSYGRAKIFRSKESFDSTAQELPLLKECGIEYKVHDAAAFHEIEPDLKQNYFKAITHADSARYANPSAAINAMAHGFAGQGGEFKIENVTGIIKQDELWRVNQKYQARNIVICAGPWANTLLKPLGHKFPIAMKRGYHTHLKSPSKISHAIVDVENGYVICPMEQGIRITTGVEFAALNAPPNPAQINQVIPKAMELVELGEVSTSPLWHGARPCTPDSLPIIGQSKMHDGLWFNVAHGHVGLTAGPSSGKLLAQMLTSKKTFCDPSPYSPHRF